MKSLHSFFQFCLLLILPLGLLHAQDTFSIVAADEETGEVGSAGASCLDANVISEGAKIISDILPGKGAIHTQAAYRQGNQTNARRRMERGDSPEEIISYMRSNDIDFNSSVRQYGVVDIDDTGQARAAAFTGSNCLDVKNHRIGVNYAIQGNILISEGILDSMEARFLRAEGTLSDRLMEALQGANVPGADSRCLAEGVSSQSAFIAVAKPDDSEEDLYLDINVPITEYGVEPIDVLQEQYDLWRSTGTSEILRSDQISLFPNPTHGDIRIQILDKELKIASVSELDAGGQLLWIRKLDTQSQDLRLKLHGKGTSYLVFRNAAGNLLGGQKVIIH